MTNVERRYIKTERPFLAGYLLNRGRGMMTEHSVSKHVDDQRKINRDTLVSNKFVPISCLHTCWTVWTLCKHWLPWQRGGAPHSPLRKKVLGSIPGLSLWILTGSACVCVGFPSTVHKHSHHFPLATLDPAISVWITAVCVLWGWPVLESVTLDRWHNGVSCLLLYEQMKWKTNNLFLGKPPYIFLKVLHVTAAVLYVK